MTKEEFEEKERGMRVPYVINDANPEATANGTHIESSGDSDEICGIANSNIETILDETGFGKFNYKIIIVSGLIAMNTSISVSSVALILMPAACDFNMSTVDKSRLNTSVLLGMLFGSYIWGCIADTKGRRIAILYCLFLEGFLNCVSSLTSNYWAFLILKFSSGIPLSGQMALFYTYLGEFQPARHREKVLSFMDIALFLGLAVAPLLAWMIIPLNVNFTYSFLFFKSWNLFIMMAALPSLLIGFMILRLPDTPMYLAESRQYKELQKVVMTMFHENTGKSPDQYNFERVNAGSIKLHRKNCASDTIITNETEKSVRKVNLIKSFAIFFKILYTQTVILLKPPHTGTAIIICLCTYFILSTLYTINVWYPELFNRFAIFEANHPGERMNICIVSKWYFDHVGKNATITNTSIVPTENLNVTVISACNVIVEPEVYMETVIVGVSSVPAGIFLLLCINRLGFRSILLFGTLVGCMINIALLFITSSKQNLILSCIYEALTTTCEVSVGCLIVEYFPTNLRATASALAAFFGRAGSLIGNTTFSYLIDDHCNFLISIVIVELFLTGLLTVFLPKRK